MIEDATMFISFWLSAAWDFFGVTMPGLEISVGAFALGAMLVAVAASLLPLVFGFGSSTEDYRSGNSGRAKSVSERRRNDEY